MSESLRSQALKELAYHQSQVDRLTKIIGLLEDTGSPLEGIPVGTVLGVASDGKQITAAKKRSQSPEAKARISAYQRKKWQTIRAVESGEVTLESLTPDQQDMIKHVSGITIHPALKSTKNSKAGTGTSAPRHLQEPSRDVKSQTKSKRLRTR